MVRNEDEDDHHDGGGSDEDSGGDGDGDGDGGDGDGDDQDWEPHGVPGRRRCHHCRSSLSSSIQHQAYTRRSTGVKYI